LRRAVCASTLASIALSPTSGAAEQVLQQAGFGTKQPGQRNRRKIVGTRNVDAQVGGCQLRFALPDIGPALQDVRRQPRGNQRHRGERLQLAIAFYFRIEDFARRAPGQHGQRRLVFRDRTLGHRDVACHGGAFGFRRAELVFSDHAGLHAVALQAQRLLARLERVLQQRELCVGRNQAEIRLRGLRGDHGAYRFTRVFRRQQVLARGAGRGAVFAPQVELIRRLHPQSEILADRRIPGRQWIGARLRGAIARRVADQVDRWVEIRLRGQHLRARVVDAGDRRGKIEIVRERLVDQLVERGIVERGPPVVAGKHVRRLRRRRRVELRRTDGRAGATRQHAGGQHHRGDRKMVLFHRIIPQRGSADGQVFAARHARRDARASLRRTAPASCAFQ
jgi:hypothetical protein